MAMIDLSERIAGLCAGKRWWLAEIALRALGLLMLAGCAQLALTVHHLATTPAPHDAGPGELARCAVIVVLLCGGFMLTFVGPGLLRDIPLPPHFTRHTDSTP